MSVASIFVDSLRLLCFTAICWLNVLPQLNCLVSERNNAMLHLIDENLSNDGTFPNNTSYCYFLNTFPSSDRKIHEVRERCEGEFIATQEKRNKCTCNFADSLIMSRRWTTKCVSW